MFVYHSLPDSTVLIVEYAYDDYHMAYHQTRQNGRELVTFTQNRHALEEERAALNQWLEFSYENDRVINYFRDMLRDCLNQPALHVSVVR